MAAAAALGSRWGEMSRRRVAGIRTDEGLGLLNVGRLGLPFPGTYGAKYMYKDKKRKKIHIMS